MDHTILLLVALALINEKGIARPEAPSSVASGVASDTIKDMFGGFAGLTPAQLAVLSPEQIRVRIKCSNTLMSN